MNMNRRQIILGGTGFAAAGLFLRPASLLAGTTAPILPEHLIHPELRPFAKMLRQFNQPLSAANLAESRKRMGKWMQPPLTDIPYTSKRIPVGRGNPDVQIFIVNAKPGTSRPAILHTHGGGFVMGDAVGGLRALQELSKALDCVIVTVEYRLAPETTYKGSIEDNYAGLKWLRDHASEIGADPTKIAVMGESAGGGHAALLAITARDRGEVPLCFQCLIYPMLDDRTGTSRAVPPHVGALIWSPDKNRFGWESFLGTKAGGITAPKNAVPARVMNLKGLPPAFIGVGTLDLFRDEDIDYAKRLNDADVPAELLIVPGAFHGFDIMGNTRLAAWFNAAKVNALRRGFGMTEV